MVQLAINDIKQKTGHAKLNKSDIGQPSDFRNLDLAEWNQLRGERNELKPIKQSKFGKLKPILMKKHSNYNKNVKVPSMSKVQCDSNEEIKNVEDVADNQEPKRTIIGSLKKMVHIPNIKVS